MIERLRRRSVEEEGVKHPIYDDVDAVDTTVIGLLAEGETWTKLNGARVEARFCPRRLLHAESGGQISDTGEIYYYPEDLTSLSGP
ncbi:MAG: hypothetical protein R2854_00380 [Caldilineaceae bacterium]